MREGVVAVIVNDGRLLVIRRSEGVPFAGYWAAASGKIEPGERQEAALVREVQEELGIAVKPVRKVWECPSSDGAFTLHWWLGEQVDPHASLDPDPREVAATRWVTPPQSS